MKALQLSFWLCIMAIPAFAQTTTVAIDTSTVSVDSTLSADAQKCVPVSKCRAAPAPLIGFGVPVALAFGGVLLGSKLLSRRRLSSPSEPQGA